MTCAWMWVSTLVYLWGVTSQAKVLRFSGPAQPMTTIYPN